jgi:hypothetical protein
MKVEEFITRQVGNVDAWLVRAQGRVASWWAVAPTYQKILYPVLFLAALVALLSLF